MPNPVVRWQIVSPDADGTAAFYQSLFHWTVSRANALGYRELSSGEGRGAYGGVWPSPPGQPGFVQMFIEVDDIQACIAEATRLGARVIVPASVLPDGDSMAVLADPTGISFGICTLRAPRA
jgi:uncharacterized protein